jgi:ubiquinone/menaquinone biosynthesis C-methylase UbiE
VTAPEMDEVLARATEDVREEYVRRNATPRPHPGQGTFQLRLEHYDALFAALDLLPLAGRQILDMGCANGAWLELMCDRWGAEPQRCCGVDLRADEMDRWRATHPDSPIRLFCGPAHELDLPSASCGLVHQSMMLSSLLNAALRERVAETMWRFLQPGGYIVSYDFWINPLNRHTIGIRRHELRRLFPAARVAFARTVTVAPPVSRLLARCGRGTVAAAERMRVLNSHYLVALARDD